MKNENLLDQFILIDKKVIYKLVEVAEVDKTDTVLEIGAGSGNITKIVAKVAGRVIAIEIDKRFKEELSSLPPNVKVIFANVLQFLEKNKSTIPHRIILIGNLPSSLVEPLLRRMVKLNFKVASFLVPMKFVKTLEEDCELKSSFKVELIEKVLSSSFSPKPKTNWAVVRINKKTL